MQNEFWGGGGTFIGATSKSYSLLIHVRVSETIGSGWEMIDSSFSIGKGLIMGGTWARFLGARAVCMECKPRPLAVCQEVWGVEKEPSPSPPAESHKRRLSMRADKNHHAKRITTGAMSFETLIREDSVGGLRKLRSSSWKILFFICFLSFWMGVAFL